MSPAVEVAAWIVLPLLYTAGLAGIMFQWVLA